MAADGRRELPQSLSQRSPGTREPLGPKHQEDDGQDDNKVGGLKDCVEHG